MHPLTPKIDGVGNSGAWNEVCSGDRVICLNSGNTGTLDECLQDGSAFVAWDNGTFGETKWCHLAPAARVEVTGIRWQRKEK